MNKKTEDQLVRLAFGDLTPEEAARLQAEAESHPDSARTLESYRRMKSELSSLVVDVPEDQLSKERLREAILKRGLRERPVKRSLSWLWMPAAACAVAFGVTFFKGHIPKAGGSPVAVMTGDIVKPIGEIDKKLFDRKPHQPTLDSVPAAASSIEEDYPTDTEDRHSSMRVASNMSRGRRDRNHGDTGWLANYTGPYGALNAPASSPTGDSTAPKSTVTDPNREKSGPETVTAGPGGPPAMNASKPPIILIQPEKDSSTGARKATEVESTSNVLVGG